LWFNSHPDIFDQRALHRPDEQTMTEIKHIKCACEKCGSPIAFPAHGIGTTVKCPHCDQSTMLCAPIAGSVDPPAKADETFSTMEESPSGDSSSPLESSPQSGTLEEEEQDLPVSESLPTGGRRWLAPLAIVLLAAGTAMMFAFRAKQAGSTLSEKPEPKTATNGAIVRSAISDPVKADGTVSQVSRAKSIADLKASPITIEKAKGSSLVYAVGRLKNDSDSQRFGVNVEIELTDAGGSILGIAKDYRNVLEPRQEWRFRALVLHPKAVSAKVAAIREEE
jgi:hypothetical protein